jgi:transposase InsO family protein
MVPGRYVVDAVLMGGLSPTELSRRHKVSRSRIYQLLELFKQGGYGALELRSRRPRSCAHQVSAEVEAAILELRANLTSAGHDAGPHTISYHLGLRVDHVPSVATIWRILRRNGLVIPQPQKRPRSSFVRFEADLPNEMWQTDATHWQLADDTDVEILNFLDDHSRLCVASDTYRTVKGPDVVQTFYSGAQRHGFPASLLSDNAAVFSGKSRKGRVFLETELDRLGILCKHSTPYHPQTCGKVERFHQTQKRYLAKQPPAATLPDLQLQLDTFRAYYNEIRPHRALGRHTPVSAFDVPLKAAPSKGAPAEHFRVRTDRVSSDGKVTLRHSGQLLHLMVGRAHKGEVIRLFVADEQVRIVRDDGLLLREMVLDPTRNYQGLGTAHTVHDVVRHVSNMS